MTVAKLQKFEAGKPWFDKEYSILSAPVRHVFMMGVIWFLTKEKKIPGMDILEIGSWYGASALSWAQGLKIHNDAKGSITCVDAWRPFFDDSTHKDDVYIKMQNSLASDEAYNIFLHNIGTIPESIKRQHFRGQSDDILPLLRDEGFDVVFIDADHTYEPVKRDIINSQRLVKDGGIICGDDLNLQMHECDQEAAKRNGAMDFVKDPKTGRNFHPGVTLAVAEIFGEVSSWGGFWAMQKKGNAWQKISLKNMPVHYPEHFPTKSIEDAKNHFADLTIT